MQRLVLKEITDELQNYDRILNVDYDCLDYQTCDKLSFIYFLLFSKTKTNPHNT